MRGMASNDSPAAVRPTGTVTFLFTDIEGSTSRWEAQSAEMGAALARHDDTLRTAIEAHGGWLFKHTGDGVLAAFASPNGAVLAAIDAQRALELPVRMGIATGEAELRGDDYFGPTLNRAARVMAAGHGGQVLLANSTAGIVTGIELLDLGERRLRDLSGAQRIFQVRAEGLRDKFPPLRTVDTVPGNLRPQATSFIGRGAEVEELVDAVRTNRLVTLTGVGGVGKTRLAIQVAAELVPDFPEGVFIVELAPVGDPAAVPDAVAGVLGVIPQAGMTVAESIAEALAGRLRLLVLDNCEHVLDAAADLVELILNRSSTMKVLATSREGLRVPAEHVWSVPSLGVRDGATSPGVALFTERARAVAPRFTIDGENEAGAVIDICRRLDGIPLAIELAAARMVSMSPAEVRDRLDDRFRLLAGGRRGIERHQTLRHAVQWSYDLLDEQERLLLNRCSVFAGGFDLACAVAVGGAGELDEYAVLDLLDALVRKSLLSAARLGAHTRYGMLETIRQFAEDQLAASGESDATRDRQARYFAAKEDAILQLWDSPKQREAYEWLDLELDNLRAAFRWASDRGDLDSAAAIAIFASLLGVWTLYPEPFAWAEDLLTRAGVSNHRRLPGLYAMAACCYLVGRAEEGIRYGEAGLALIDAPGFEPPPFGAAHVTTGFALMYAGRPDAVIQLFAAEITHAGDHVVMPRAMMAQSLAVVGRTDEAIRLAESAISAAEPLGNPAMLAYCIFAFGMVSTAVDPGRALLAFRRCLTVARAGDVRAFEANANARLAPLEAEHGDRRTALDLFAQAIDTHHDCGDSVALLTAFAILAVTFEHNGRSEAAAVLHGASDNSVAVWVPGLPESVARLREVLGGAEFERLGREGAAMERAAAVRYAHEQIQLSHAELVGAS